MSLADLFRPSPRPRIVAIGVYKCRRCEAKFIAEEMRPCPANIGTFHDLGNHCFYRTASHTCGENGDDLAPITEYGVGDLIGATVKTEYPTTVEKP